MLYGVLILEYLEYPTYLKHTMEATTVAASWEEPNRIRRDSPLQKGPKHSTSAVLSNLGA